MFTVQEKLELKIFNAVERIMIELILKSAEQSSSKEANRKIEEKLKEIVKSNKQLVKANYPLTSEIINEMIDEIPEQLLPVLPSEYLTGSDEEKEEIMNELDLERCKQETFVTITSHLKKNGFLSDKKPKGFGKKI